MLRLEALAIGVLHALVAVTTVPAVRVLHSNSPHAGLCLEHSNYCSSHASLAYHCAILSNTHRPNCYYASL
jgi:hypothetical protein